MINVKLTVGGITAAVQIATLIMTMYV